MSLLKSFTRKVSHAQVHIDYKSLQPLPVQYQSLCVHFYIKVHHCIPLFKTTTPNTGHRYYRYSIENVTRQGSDSLESEISGTRGAC